MPLHFPVAPNCGPGVAFSTRHERIGTLEATLTNSLPQRVALLADADGVLTQAGAERLLDEQDGLETGDVNLVEQPPEAPTDTLTRHSKAPVDRLAVRAAQHHVAGPVRLQLDP